MGFNTKLRAVTRVLGMTASAACLVTAATIAGPAIAHASTGDPNAGDVWVDNVGQPAGPGHEMDPHLACQNINLWGNGLADSSGNYSIDGWPPSGSMEQDYASSWKYNTTTGGTQVIDVINVAKLVQTAISNGDTPQPHQGFHFKLQFSQDPQKHKTFWVKCQVGQLEIHKNAPSDSQKTVFTFDVNCGAAGSFVRTVTGTGNSAPITNLLLGTSCTVHEVPLPTFVVQPDQTVKITKAGVTVVVTFTNVHTPPPPPPPTKKGFLEVCKKASGSGLDHDVFTFTVAGKSYMVPVGACTAAITLPAGNATVSEVSKAGSQLVGVATIPANRLVSDSLSARTATVKIVAGNVSTETIVTFTNKAVVGNGFLKICKVAGSGIKVGADFHFSVGGKSVTVPAGPAPGGYCVVVGKFPFGHETITESVPSGDKVSSIAVAPSNRQVSKDLSTATVTVNIGSGVTEATFTNQTS